MRTLALAVVTILVVGSGVALADHHPFFRQGENDVDLVMSVAWSGKDTEQPNREFLTNTFRQFASRTQKMTLGNVSICRVYVYFDGKHSSLANGVVINKIDRSNARIGGLMSTTTPMELYVNGKGVTTFGNVTAHEFGHYGLALRDEYTEEKEKGPRTYFQTRKCDVAMETVMGQSGAYTKSNLSVPSDYTKKNYAPWKWKDSEASGNKEQRYLDCDKIEPSDGANESATWRTSHWRLHRESAWEVLIDPKRSNELKRRYKPTVFGKHPFKALRALTSVPESLTRDNWDESCFEVIFMEGTVGAMYIDGSISMNAPSGLNPADAEETKFEAVIAGALVYVDSLPVDNAITVYPMGGSPIIPVTWIKGDPAEQAAARQTIKDAILSIPVPTGSIGATAISNSLQNGFGVLISKETLGARHYAMVMSDGSVIPDLWAVLPFKVRNIPIFTVVLGSIFDSLPAYDNMRKLTKGKRLGIRNIIRGYKTVKRRLDEEISLGTGFVSEGPKDGEPPAELVTDVTAIDGSTTFGAEWYGTANFDVQLVSPDQQIITPTNLPAGITYESEEGARAYEVTNPMPGQWRTLVNPPSTPGTSDELALYAQSHSPLRLSVSTTGSGDYPEPWVIEATLSAPKAVVGAVVKASFLDGPVGQPDLMLLDNGEGADALANDGVYTGVVSTLIENGEYKIEIEASNAGDANVDSSQFGDGSDEPPLALGAFTRSDEVSIESMAYQAMPQDSQSALMLRNDFTPLWATIDEPGDVVWFQFNGFATGSYRMVTGHLISNDAQEMKTRVTLYDADGATELQVSELPDGRASIDIDVPPSDQIYFLKVEHADQGVGRFQIAVAPVDWFESDPDMNDSEGCGCSTSSSQGASAGWLLLLLFVWRRRPKRRPGKRDILR